MKIIPTAEEPSRMHDPISSAEKPRIAYLLSQYPAVSHTFFLKELLGLEQLGFQIETCSINPPDRSMDRLTAAEAKEAGQTYYLKPIDYWGTIGTLLSVLFGHPKACLRGIHAAAKLGTLDVYRHFYRLLYLMEALLIGAWMKRHRLHHLHVHFGGSVATVGLLAAKAWGFSYSLTIHGPEEFYDVEHYYLPEKFRHAAFIFCISHYCRSQVMKYSTASQWKNFHVVPLGVDPQHFVPQPHPPKNVLQLACVGRLVPAKGQLILLLAMGKLIEEGHSIHLILIGDGSDRRLLQDFVIQQKLTEHVTLLGALNHEETRARLAQTDIFVLPSFAEGVPVALMEAMAMEIPCVSTQIAGIPELIQNEFEGLLVPASSYEALAAAIKRLIQSPELRRRLGTAARKKVINCYNLDKNIEKLAGLFEECLAKRTA
jgi:colanic acid/amylovoran biosynthesis glycosyltransferase